jgi:hypothetical protein
MKKKNKKTKGDFEMKTKNEIQAMLEKEREEQATIYGVIVDGNRHHLGQRIATKKEMITVAKCRELAEKIENRFNIKLYYWSIIQ